MLSNNILIFIGYGLLTVVIIIGGLQDWRSGMVSNWITIPLFAAGVIACAWRFFSSDQRDVGIVLSIMVLILTVSALKGWMGGADWKILIGLFGLWPLAGFASLAVAGVWGVVEMLRTRKLNSRFPGVTAFAVATALTFLVQLS